jgi:hypothetical protein
MITETFWQGFRPCLTVKSFIMKNTLKGIIAIIIVSLALAFSGCSEPRYYHTYHHHTRGWYDRRHVPPPAGVNFEIDISTRHRHRY